MEFLHLILQALVYPGLLFTILFIIFTQWVNRKLTARLQFRRGPIHAGPAGLLQPLADLLKLVAKKDLINKYSMKLSPVIFVSLAIGFIIVVQLALPVAYAPISAPYDLIVLLYFMLIAPLAIAYLAVSHPNPYTTIGAARYLALLIVSEPVFAITLLVPFFLTSRLNIPAFSMYWTILHSSMAWTIDPLGALSMALATIAAFISMLAVLFVKPFDAPEAESEIYWGVFTEVGGPRLALGFFLKFAERVVYPLIFAGLFLGGTWPFMNAGWALQVLVMYFKALIVFVVVTIIDAVLPRYRPDQAVAFILKYVYPIAIIALALTLI
ncbi:MAG: complex I subunit 1 family protein [Desulfurococcaceae archaeon TW002]